MTITAPIYKVMETQTFESGFQKRTLVLRTTGDYPQTIPFDFIKDRVTMLDNVKEGQMATVEYDIRGNEYNGKFYVNLQAWRIDVTEDGSEVIANVAVEKAKPALNGDMANQFNEQQDDLPF